MRLTGRYLEPTLRIRYAHGPATGILIRVAGKTYVVTAAHVVAGMQDGENIEFRIDDGWGVLPVQRARFSPDNDLVVLGPLKVDGELGLSEEYISSEMVVGSAAAYCGFPLDLEGTPPPGHRWPIPIVKSAVYSGQVRQGTAIIQLFDTVNNQGFSGGPVFVNDGTASPKLSAIVSAYRFDRPIPVMRRDENGDFVEDPDHFVRPNSGFMMAVSIGRALDLVRAR